MSDPVLSRLSERLIGSRWRDEHGNEYAVYGVYHTDDPELSLRYVPPKNQKLTLSEVEARFTLIEEGYDVVS